MRAVSSHAAIGVLVALVVAGAVTAGLAVTGSPAQARLERLDGRRIDDLQNVSGQIDSRWIRDGRLPASLEELASSSRSSVPRDPVTGEPYEFRVTAERRYELCAVFARRSSEASRGREPGFWRHDAGRTCFPLEVRLPPRS